MAFTPTGAVYLCDTPLDNKYKNQILFTSSTYQWDYFRSTVKHEFHGCTYQRKDNSIRVSACIDDLWDVNYVMYQNANFSTKWFYAFITKMVYVSANVVDIFIETDVFQTWRSETALMRSFTVREHVDDDSIGLHLVDEQLEIGEYKMSTYGPVDKMGTSWNIVALSDTAPLLNGGDTVGNIYGNVISGLLYVPFPNDVEGMQWLKTLIQTYTGDGKPEAIVMIFTVPKLLIPMVDNPEWVLGTPLPSGDIFRFDFFTTEKQLSTLDGYSPKNKKLHTYPFKYVYVSNNTGQSAVYRYEDWAVDNVKFMISGAVMPNPSIMLIPEDYRGAGVNYEYGLTLSGFPLGSWTSDAYTAWFAQNAASAGIALAGSALAIVGGGMTGNPLAIAGGVLGVASEMAQINKAMIQPDQAKGQTGSGSLHFGINTLDFYYAHTSIKAQYAKMVDDFLSMYGYKVNALKVPETRSRFYWNYIKTIDVNIDGSIPDDDMGRLKQAYNDGITLWHDPALFLRYDLTNDIGDLGASVPTCTNATTNTAGTIITLTFNKSMSNPASKKSEFTITVGGVSKTISTLTLNADTSKIDITLSTPIPDYSSVISITYTKGTLLASDKGILASFTRSVANNVPRPIVNLLSLVTNTAGSQVILTMDKAMNNPTGKQSYFGVKAELTPSYPASPQSYASRPYQVVIHRTDGGGDYLIASTGKFYIESGQLKCVDNVVEYYISGGAWTFMQTMPSGVNLLATSISRYDTASQPVYASSAMTTIYFPATPTPAPIVVNLTVNSVALDTDNKKIILTLASAIALGYVVKTTYYSDGNISSTDGSLLAQFIDSITTNNRV